jgi:hypothetical protein
MKWRVGILLATILVATIAVFFIPPIPQSQAYHNFADKRSLFGVPNCLDVISNGLFLIVGLLGLRFVSRSATGKGSRFIHSGESWPWLAFFGDVTLTAFGSAYYHLNPNDSTLVWDRIPMAISFIALVVAVIGERISVRAADLLLLPLLLLAVGSVLYWSETQMRGHGDLRPYVLLQFGSLPVLLLLLVLFKPQYTRGSDLMASLAIYVVAKFFEAADA